MLSGGLKLGVRYGTCVCVLGEVVGEGCHHVCGVLREILQKVGCFSWLWK